MKFEFPKFRINDSLWYLNEQDKLSHGEVKLITLAISEHECTVYYHIDNNGSVVVNERQVVDPIIKIPIPKYNLNDVVKYTYATSKDKQLKEFEGTIDKIDIQIVDKIISVMYYMDDDPDFFVLEDEIVGFGETSFNAPFAEDRYDNIIDMTEEQWY